MTEKKKKALFLCTLCFVLLAIVTGIYILLRHTAQPANAQSGPLIANDTQDWNSTLPENGSTTGMGETKIPGYGVLRIAENTKQVNITLPNPKENDCYFQYKLKLKEDTLYTSGLIAPGKAIKTFALSKALSAGEYTLTIEVIPYTLKEQTPLIATNINAQLVVV